MLIAGWFSFEQMGATAGDLLVRDLVCEWTRHADVPFDVAVAPPFQGGVDWRTVNPADYSRVAFVCGPFGNGWPIPDFLERFPHCQKVGVNLSMIDPLDVWNPFDLLLERDSSATVRPDLAFAANQKLVPVVGVLLVHPQKEYQKAMHGEANSAIRRLTETREMAVVNIDTRLDVNGNGLRTPAEIESLIARMDLVLTTRLHGLVLALKNGVPAVAIDPIPGGAKVWRQARAVGWPSVFTADALDEVSLRQALDYCLSDTARVQARTCCAYAIRELTQVRENFHAFLASAGFSGNSHP
jgi:hypothetical protein